MNIEIINTHFDMSYEEYEKLDGIRTHELIDLSKSPFHYKNRDKVEFSGAEFGRAVHTAILEPELFKFEVKELFKINNEPLNLRLKAHREYVEQSGIKFLSLQEMEMIENYKNQFNYTHHSFDTEVSFQYRLNGILCKSRIDYIDLKHGFVGDIKTISNEYSIGNPLYYFQKSNYDVQGYLTWRLATTLIKTISFPYIEFYMCFKNAPYPTQSIFVAPERLADTAIPKLTKALENLELYNSGLYSEYESLSPIFID